MGSKRLSNNIFNKSCVAKINYAWKLQLPRRAASLARHVFQFAKISYVRHTLIRNLVIATAHTDSTAWRFEVFETSAELNYLGSVLQVIFFDSWSQASVSKKCTTETLQ